MYSLCSALKSKWVVKGDSNNKEGEGTDSKPPRKFPVPLTIVQSY